MLSAETGDLVCAGLYSDAYFEGASGIFFFKINASDGRIYSDQIHKFSQEFIERLSGDPDAWLKDTELYKYKVSDLVLRDNGNIILIAEQLYDQSYETYNNLIVASFDVDGKFHWEQVIKKNQNFNITMLEGKEIETEQYRDLVIRNGFIDYSIENYCSYALLAPLDRDEIVIFYNDNIKNIENLAKPKSFGHPKKSYLSAVYIDRFGNATKMELLKWKRKSLYIEPIRYYHNLKNTIIIPAFRGRKYNYYKLDVNF